jgi:hypothetical protein
LGITAEIVAQTINEISYLFDPISPPFWAILGKAWAFGVDFDRLMC